MKPKREITLGEMQDECKRALGCCIDGGCRVRAVCPTYLHLAPDALDLTDPPRFTEAQMALLRWWYEQGAVKAGLAWDNHWGDMIVFRDIKDASVGNMQESSISIAFKGETRFIDMHHPLDLAEMFGKEEK